MKSPHLILLLCLTALSEESQTEWVTVKGSSAVSYDSAVQSAIRNAVRQLTGVVVHANSVATDFILVRDSIYLRAQGYARSYKVLERRRGLDGTYIVKLSVQVAKEKIENDALAILSLIESLGRPEFVVTVEARKARKEAVKEWVQSAINKWLDQTGFSVLHSSARQEQAWREYWRALRAGEHSRAKATLLSLGAPYAVRVVAFAETKQQNTYAITANYSVVELRATVVERSTASILADFMSQGKAARADASAIQDACRRAVDRLFNLHTYKQTVIGSILNHWLKYLDTGWSLTLTVYGGTYQDLSDLKHKIETLEEVKKIVIKEAPLGGVAELRIIARLSASDLAYKIAAWTGQRFYVGTEGPLKVSITRKKPTTTLPGIGSTTASHQKTHPGGRYTTTTPPGAPSLPATTPRRQVSPPPLTQIPPPTRRDLVIPALIIGASLFVAIVLSALLLRRRR